MERKYFEGFEGLKVPYLFFESERGEKFKNNIIIFHGVTEPIDRYEEFGKFLSANGYNVFVPEIRGHGELKTSEVCEFGKKGIKAVFEDINLFFKNELMPKGIKAENTTIFGHSMGSLIAMKWVIGNNYKYFILSGFPLQKKLSVFLGKMLTGLEKLLFFKKKSFMNKEFKKYNDYFKPNQTKFDWLTRDENEVNKYVESEFCGYPISPGVFNGILGMMGFINRKYKKIRKDANMLVIYGTEDKAVNTEYVTKILEILKKKKRRINVLENKNGRHESLNEINKYEIYDEILKWLNEREK
jgi:alpha/beta hydrolase family protein